MPTDDQPDAGTTRIRAGVIVGGAVVPAHVAEAVTRILAEPGVDALVLAGAPQPLPRGGRLFRVYRAVDRRVFRPALDPHRPVRLTVPLVRDDPGALDVVIALDGATAPNLDTPPRHGWWAFGHDRGPGAAFWPLAAGHPTVTSSLVETTADGRRRERYRSVGPVDRFSLTRTDGPLRWKAATFPARALATVRREGWGTAEAPLPHDPPRASPLPPSTSVMVRFLARLGVRVARRAAQRLVSRNEWFVAYRRRTPGAPPPTDLRGFTPIQAPTDTFYADPFVLADEDGSHRLFVESYSRTTRLGAIAELRLDDERRGPWPARPVLDRPFHLSYPFVTTDDEGGGLILIPESGDTGTTTRYRSTDDGVTWTADGTVLDDTLAYDPTILRHGGWYWLFVAIAVRGGSPWDELFLYRAPAVTGPWTAHPANPVVSDVRSARPAGRIFERQGRLIRPAQDCSGAYGRRVVLQEIVQLDGERYDERPWSSIEPVGIRGVRRTHCYTFDGGYEVVDGFRHRRRVIGSIGRRARG